MYVTKRENLGTSVCEGSGKCKEVENFGGKRGS